ncbi:MAG: hypothetical protein HXY45_14730 [Syntrophaceae bacterium]|nr:hypothetical protein [Syntrophaceae bacterium]
MRKGFSLVAVLLVGLMLAVGCSRDKEPAEAAIKAAESAWAAAKGEAAKFVPDKVKGVEDGLKAAKDAFEKKEYTQALNAAKDLPGQIKDLAAAAAAKKAELTKSWEEMAAGLPKMVEAIKSRVDILSKSKKLPANLDKAKFEGAKAGLEEINKAWMDAEGAFKGGNIADALSKGNAVKAKATEIMNTLGMQPPPAAKTS